MENQEVVLLKRGNFGFKNQFLQQNHFTFFVSCTGSANHKYIIQHLQYVCFPVLFLRLR